jgi:tetratricopeptide (TPR) repeat protein
VRAIGTELGVEAVLEGSVRKAGEKVRVTAQLIKTRDGFHAWSEVYDRKLEDIFAIQDDISRAIADKLRLHFKAGSGTSVSPSYNMEAYQQYLKAMHYWNKWTPDDSRSALKLLEDATRIDPTFALAYAWQAFCYTYLGALGQLPPNKAFPAAKELTAKAFALKGAIAECHLASGLIDLFYEWNWDNAEIHMRKALEISPGNAAAHHLYGMYLTIVGDLEKSVAEVELSHKLNPFSPITSYALAEAYFCSRRYHDALNQCRQTLQIDPTFRAAKNLIAWIQIETGEIDKAIAFMEEIRKEIGDDLKGWTQLGFAYGIAGRRAEAEECLRKLKLRQERDPETQLNVDFAVVSIGLNDPDAAFRYLDAAMEQKAGGLVFMKTHPGWDRLRPDPRFRDLLRRIGLEK